MAARRTTSAGSRLGVAAARELLLVLGVAVVVRVVASSTSGDVRLALLNLLMLTVAAGSAVLIALRARRHQGPSRQHLLWLSAGAGAWALGQAYWTFAEVLLNHPQPFPSLADVGFLLLYPPLVVAVLVAPSTRLHHATRRRRFTDALGLSASLLLLLWATALLTTLDIIEHGGLLRASIGVAYPSGDVVIGSLVLVLLMGARPSWSPVLALYAASLLSLLVADAGFAYLSATGEYATGSWLDLGWVVGFGTLLVAARRVPVDDRDPGAGVVPHTRLATAAPLAGFLVAGAVGLRETYDGDLQAHPILMGLLSTVFLAAILRALTARAEGEAYALELASAQQSLTDARREHVIALQAAGMVTLRWSAAEDRWTVGEGGAELLGLLVEGGTFTTSELMPVLTPADQDAIKAAFAAVTPADRDYDLELEVPTRHGSRHLRTRGEARLDDKGEVSELVGVLFDVTESWRARQAEERREANTAALAALESRLARTEVLQDALEDAVATLAGLVDASEAELRRGNQVVVHWPPGREERLGQTVRELDLYVAGELWGTLTVRCQDGAMPVATAAFVDAAASLVVGAVERVRAQELLWRGARYDALTGLPNRVRLAEHLSATLASGPDNVLAVAYLDLDDFKSVNDRYGHPVGDRLLQVVATRLHSCLRPGDVVARLGGDEFAFVMSDLPGPDAALDLASRVQRVLAEPADLGVARVPTGASIGVATTVQSGRSGEHLMRNADLAMYVAKRSGGGQVALFEERFHQEAKTQGELSDALREALPRGEMLVHYQPVVDLTTGHLCGAEALLRWLRPGQGLQAPHLFLPAAERLGLMDALSVFVLLEACRWAQEYVELHPLEEFVVAVNVTPADVRSAGFAETVSRALDETGLDPGRLSLEIVESGVLADVPAAAKGLTALRSRGVRVAIDDFGTGYSSLSQLKSLPMDTVKIDKGFVAGLGTQLDDSALVSALITMAHTLGLDVIAEGVETDRQRAALAALGCEKAQGYLFGRPVGVRPAAFGPALTRSPLPAPRTGAWRPARSWTVVIADDLEDDRRILARYLTRSGLFTVVGEAADGAEAVRVVHDLHPDVALLDVSMPVLDGFDALAGMRLDSPGTDVVMLTGYLSEAVVRTASEGGALGCLAKGSTDPSVALVALLERSEVSHGPSDCDPSGG